MLDIIIFLLQIYLYAVIAWIILSWIRVSPDHPVAKLSVLLDRIIYPVLLPLRRVIPPLRLGGGLLDLSPIVLIIGIQILISILN
ncbi:MAG: YggT family protein [Actinobacteria bacterium]|nr:MAG: YggT family protein [Actinomycetota bacterium]